MVRVRAGAGAAHDDGEGGGLIFYLGTHKAVWLERTALPLMVSRRTLERRTRLPRALGPWVLDSGGFSELTLTGAWGLDARAYAAQVRRYADEIGSLAWAAPQDWMCEAHVRAKTGLSTAEHQRRTVDNFCELRALLGPLVIPVLQGEAPADYWPCVDLYERAGVDLWREPLVGVGTVCRRSSTGEAALVLRPLADAGLRLHAFGIKGETAAWLADSLVSSDSMAWSYAARRESPLPGCPHARCSNCMRYALAWRERLVSRFAQLRLWEDACAVA